MKIRKLSLIKLWESQLYRPLYVLVETWQFGGHNKNPIELIKKGKRKMFKLALVLVSGLGLFFYAISLIKAGVQSSDIIIMASVGMMFLSIAFMAFMYECWAENFRPARKFIRSMVALDKILIEVGRAGIASLPQNRQEIKEELRDILVWEARLKLEAERRDRYGEDVQKHDSRFRRLVEAIENMGFKVDLWDSYYSEAKQMLEQKSTKRSGAQERQVPA